MSIATEIQRLQTAKADLKTAIEAKGVTVDETATIDTYASKIDEIQSGGSGMTMANYASKIQFASDDWATSDTVVLDVPNLSTLDNIFFNFVFEKIKHLTINSNTPIASCLYAFRGSNGVDALETVVLNVDTSQAANWNNMFFKQSALKRIEGTPLNFSGATDISPFAYTYKVEHFRVVPESIKIKANFGNCAVIDDGTVDSVVNGLFDLTGATAQTLTLHANVKARIQADEAKEDTDSTKHHWLSTITGKNWTIA